MLIPKYTISNRILNSIGVIEAAKEVILNSSLITAWELKFKKEALERSIHFGTHLEGNRLSLEETQQVLDGQEVVSRARDLQEVINYRNVLKFVDNVALQISPGRRYVLTLETILEIHRLTVENIAPPQICGRFRLRQVVLKNSKTGEVSYTPPPAAEVPYLVEDLLNWVNGDESRETHPIIKAGIIHYELFRIHPFVEGNGRTARAVATLVLFLEGYDFRKLFSLEEYFDTNPLDYYLTLQSVSNQLVLDNHERDLTPWLEYFTQGVANELGNLKEKVRRISVDSKVRDKLGEQVELNERQMLIMEYLHRHKTMQNKDFRKIFPDFSDDTVLRELRFLNKKGLVKKEGGTKRAVYTLT